MERFSFLIITALWLRDCKIANAATNAIPTNVLAIHLVQKVHGTNNPLYGPPELADVEIDPEPLVADSDFVLFDAEKQIFALSDGAARKFSMSLGVYVLDSGNKVLIPHTARFVLKANGEPIYVGLIGTRSSSKSFSGPTIISPLDFLKPGVTRDVPFRIFAGYPGPFDFNDTGVPNSRRDPRILAAAQQLAAKRSKPDPAAK